MSIASTTRKAGPYTGNGSTTVFPFSFKVFQASDLVVTQTDLSGVETTLALTSAYTVSLNSNQDSNPGGSITCLSAPSSGFLITITSNVPELQPVVLTNNGGFYPSVINDALDRLTIFAQQISEQVSRAVKVGVSSSTSPDSLIASVISSAASAASSAASALASWNSFQGIYYGPLSADPTTDPLGNPCGLGDEYFSTSTNALRIYTSTGWQDTAVATPVAYNTQLFNGTGAQTAFTLSSAPASLLATEVFISGVRQRPTTDYTVSGATLTFTTAPASGTNNIFVRWTNAIAVGVPNNKSVTYPKIQDVQNKRLLGRNTAAAGDVEEVTLTQLLDWIGTAAQGDILFRGASAWQRLAAGTAGQFLKTLGAGVDPAWAPLTGITSGTAVATSSGTAIDFTGIPSWVKRITVMLNGVSTNGASAPVLRLGAGSIQSSGYAGTSSAIAASSAGSSGLDTSGFIFPGSGSASAIRHGVFTFVSMGSNIWCLSGMVSQSDAQYSNIVSGSVTLSGTLDRLRLTTVNGTDAFDAGSVNILYEG